MAYHGDFICQDCFTLRVVAVDPRLLSPSFAGTCFSSFVLSAGTCFRMAPPPSPHPRALGGPIGPPPPKGPWGGPQGPPRAQGALRAPWGRTALRAALKLLFVFSCTVIYIEAIGMKGVLHKESVRQTQMWAGDKLSRMAQSVAEWPRMAENV